MNRDKLPRVSLAPTFSAEELASEEWRVVPSFPDYEASNLGRVRSLKYGRVKVLKPCIDKLGYAVYHPCMNNKVHNRAAHLMVLDAFVGPRPAGMEGRHFPDRDPGNNRIENLSYGTPRQNCADRDFHGTTARGDRHGRRTCPRVKTVAK